MDICQCRGCEFFRLLDPSEEIGDCRRASAKARPLDGEETYLWPQVYIDDFCGEFVAHTGKFTKRR